jgi:hypothetical protein
MIEQLYIWVWLYIAYSIQHPWVSWLLIVFLGWRIIVIFRKAQEK